ncbi:hypothetical protein A5722_19880 [Mycobacterium vulneris]|nr:hypothetical protein A5722_19880 [Mycolicibacterium vulneris]
MHVGHWSIGASFGASRFSAFSIACGSTGSADAMPQASAYMAAPTVATPAALSSPCGKFTECSLDWNVFRS